ncbi:MAG TPA: glycosyltransferase family 39 protein [Pseudomonadales bacterium]|nr:glycosyltransferase family 39 protein [Pseudomonadales bacterium]
MLSFLRQASPTRLAVFLIAVLTLFRLWYSTQVGLIADEAYYWLWARHPALSYRDKGPLVAWFIWVGIKMFGNTVFGIRFFAVLLSSATGWLIFVLARRLYDERTALWCLLMALVIPEMAVGSIIMTIDTPSVFFWALAAMLFWNGLHNDKISTWFWLGLAVGAGFLAKFTNGVQLIGIGFFLIWAKEYRHLLISRKTIAMSVAFLLSSLPILIWNIQTHWVHLIALHSRSGVTNTFHISLTPFSRFVGEQFGVISPFFMAGIVVAAVALFLHHRDDLRVRFLLSLYLPVYALFGFFALNNAGQPNWTVPALVTGIVFTVVYWREVVARSLIWRRIVTAAFIITAIATAALHDVQNFHLPAKVDLLARAEGWPDFVTHLQKVRTDQKVNLLLGSDYQSASLMAFYLPDQPHTYLPPAPYGSSQFTLWPSYEVTPDTRAIYLTWNEQDAPDSLKKQFPHIQLVDDFFTQNQGLPRKHVCIYLCTQ